MEGTSSPWFVLQERLPSAFSRHHNPTCCAHGRKKMSTRVVPCQINPFQFFDSTSYTWNLFMFFRVNIHVEMYLQPKYFLNVLIGVSGSGFLFPWTPLYRKLPQPVSLLPHHLGTHFLKHKKAGNLYHGKI